MLLSITQYGDPVLRAVSAPVEHVDDAIRGLASNMIETMYAANGIGLAAPQVGENLRLVVIDIPEDEEEGAEPEMATINGELRPIRDIMPLVFINPSIEPYGKQELFTEGCLSVRNIRANVCRLDHVKASLPQLDGTVLEVDCGGLLARCLQHECDHLDGFLFTDRVSSAAKITLAKKLKKLAQQG
ncbi:MAG: peptide deformylase [Akkermansia sp.]|nr:peptide deformylase [Akkermansia sp.]MBQ7024787.1 peptide deformylase [Akkermansia sp.]